MAWVYILQCRDGSLYVGSTKDLERRLFEHQSGMGAQYTRHRLPVKLIWAAEFDRVDDAFAFEKQVQGWSRRKRLSLVEGRYDSLPELASRARVRREVGFETRRPPGGAPQPTE